MLPMNVQQPSEEQPLPTCGVVIEKNDDGEKTCGEVGSHAVFMVDPETRSRVTAILVVCPRHDQELEDGKELIFVAENREDHILVSYKKENEDVANQ